jgi:hypothetical protein
MEERKTAGELSLKATSDNTKYDPLEIGYALTDDVIHQLQVCGQNHSHIFDEHEYFLVLIVAGDPLIKGVRRHKYAAFIHMPKPRPQQSCFLYNKFTGKIKRLWSLPDAKVMATISQMSYVDKKWRETKGWCDAFFCGWMFDDATQTYINTNTHHFFDYIRKQHGIKHLSESEYLDAHREELIKAGCKETDTALSDPFDFSKVSIEKIVDTKTALAE